MWVKVCGLTNVENALDVCQCGVNAVGLNFYSKSKRYITPHVAKEIVDIVPKNIEPVGLFVNHTRDEIEEIVAATGIRTIQLHGNETAEFAATLTDLKIIRAVRINEQNISQLAFEINQYQQFGVDLFACLIDAHVDGQFGGTGETAPWERLVEKYDFDNWPRLILAGGLTHENVATAIQTVHPWGVDTASGVESKPGIKDRQQVAAFVENAKSIT